MKSKIFILIKNDLYRNRILLAAFIPLFLFSVTAPAILIKNSSLKLFISILALFFFADLVSFQNQYRLATKEEEERTLVTLKGLPVSFGNYYLSRLVLSFLAIIFCYLLPSILIFTFIYPRTLTGLLYRSRISLGEFTFVYFGATLAILIFSCTLNAILPLFLKITLYKNLMIIPLILIALINFLHLVPSSLQIKKVLLATETKTVFGFASLYCLLLTGVLVPFGYMLFSSRGGYKRI